MSVYFRAIPMYKYTFCNFAMICSIHLTMDTDENIMTDEEIDHYVSLMDLGKEKKKLAKKMIKEMRIADPTTCRDERVFVEVFKLLSRKLRENWCTNSIETYYHNQLEHFIELTMQGKKTEEELLIASKNIKEQMMHIRDELFITCCCGDMLVSFDMENDSFKIVILPCGTHFK